MLLSVRDRNLGCFGDTTVIVCDGCEKPCEESRQPGTDNGPAVGWHGTSARLAAVRAGWVERLDGRLAKIYCPECTTKEAPCPSKPTT